MKHLNLVKVFLGIVFISLVTMGMREIFIPGKRYPFSLTQDQWNSRLNFIQHGIVLMRTSSAPGIEIAAAQDSLIQFAQEIQQQIIPQINADTVKSKK